MSHADDARARKFYGVPSAGRFLPSKSGAVGWEVPGEIINPTDETARGGVVETIAAEEQEYVRVLNEGGPTLRNCDIDAFADGVLAHRMGEAFHQNPDGIACSVRRLSWAMGWNERALRQ